MTVQERYEYWLTSPAFDEATREELRAIKDDPTAIAERFTGDLEFGTGGLRGVIGAGTNRMNVYTVRKATQGIANYILQKGTQKKGVAISYDSRRMSPEFADETARCFCANGIPVYIFPMLHPTPMLSFAVRDLGCTAGVNITASHNPPEYNGYKLYWEDGAQVTVPDDELIIAEVNKITDYAEPKTMSRQDAMAAGLYRYIGSDLDERYYENVKQWIKRPDVIAKEAKNITVAYTPLHGTGYVPSMHMLRELGFTAYAVPEQSAPDGEFPTVGYPNPEDAKAMKMALELGEKVKADLVLANDPDADRIGSYVRDGEGKLQRLTGNMMGALLCNYEIESAKEIRGLRPDSTVVSTIVSTNMTGAIARKFGVNYYETLTGFKHICGKMRELEETASMDFLFGYEESYGCLVGTYARDKDGIMAVTALAEAACYYKTKGKTLWDVLQDLYAEVGFYRDINISRTFKGLEGAEKIRGIMSFLRNDPPKEMGGLPVVAIRDYKEHTTLNLKTGEKGVTTLPTSNVLYYELTDDAWVCVRPSGTEPKIKLYCGVCGKDKADADEKERVMIEKLNAFMDQFE